MKFADLRVKTKLMLGFAAVATIVLLVSARSEERRVGKEC